MRIAMVGPFGFHPNKTMAVRALPLARALVTRGHDVRLLMPPWQTPAEADRSWEEDRVEIRYTPLKGGVPGAAWRLVQETLSWEPDVVHCFKPKPYSVLVAWWLWQFHHRRLWLVTDSDDWEGWGGWNDLAPYSPVQKRFFAWQERWGLRHCHRLTVASRALETIALSMGIPPQRVVYVPNGPGVAVAEQGSRGAGERGEEAASGRVASDEGAGKRPSLLVYSRLFEFDTGRLVGILRGVQTAVPQINILLVGAGLYTEDAAQFRAQLEAAGLLPAVTDAGWVEPARLPQTLAAADVGIYLMADTLLNRTKCPVKLADMLAAGVPVVGEAVGQVPEYVVHGRSGYLCTPGDDDSITTALIHLLQDKSERKRLAAGAQAHMRENFSWAQLAAVVERAYRHK